MLQQVDPLETSEVPFLDPPPYCYWTENEDGYLILSKLINGKVIDTRIHVCPHHTGVFSLVIGEAEITYMPTLRQAINIADTIAFIFQDSLPAPAIYIIRQKTVSQHQGDRTYQP